MRGHKVPSSKLFYTFSLDQKVAAHHPLRRLAAVLDFRFVEEPTRGLYGHNGQVSVDPVVIMKILLLGFLYNIPSIRELMRQLDDRLSFRWFIGYDIDEAIPDHSVISKARRRFGPKLFQEFFDRTVGLCQDAGLVGGDLVHVDSTKIAANASLKSVKPLPEAETFHPVLTPQGYWDALDQDEQAQEEALDNADDGHDAPRRVNDRMRSTTDPDAAVTSRDGKGLAVTYSDHRAVDDRCGVILETQATAGDVADNAQLPPLISALIFRHHAPPQAIAGDRLYGTVENYKRLDQYGILPYLRRKESAHKKGRFRKTDFRYLPDQDQYVCPAGERLLPQSERSTRSRLFRGSQPVCAACSLRAQCTTARGPRTVTRHSDERYLEKAVARKDSFAFRHALKRRQTVMEGSFADAKTHRAHARARWRRLTAMQIQCWLVAAAQNLNKFLKYATPTAQTAAQVVASPRKIVEEARAVLGFARLVCETTRRRVLPGAVPSHRCGWSPARWP